MNVSIQHCAVCGAELKLEKQKPEHCHICGADTDNPGETQKASVNCDYQKSLFGLWPGTLILTDKRVFWVKGGVHTVSIHAGTLGGLASSVANSVNAGQTQVNVGLSDIARVEAARKGIRSGIAICTKNGEIYKFFSGKLKSWIDMLSQLIG
ncbi:MAG: hypothetical protein LBK23_07820 [Oscillospiraceae bacterium]|nr:hypothetical protein [Oscillospiraceae bacterium]